MVVRRRPTAKGSEKQSWRGHKCGERLSERGIEFVVKKTTRRRRRFKRLEPKQQIIRRLNAISYKMHDFLNFAAAEFCKTVALKHRRFRKAGTH